MKNVKTKTPILFAATVVCGLLFQFISCSPETGLPTQDDVVRLPDDAQIEVFGKVRMQWAPTDFREIVYDAAKNPVRVRQENLFVENSDITRKVQYDFLYDENQHLKQIRTDKFYINYSLEGDHVKETKEYALDETLIRTRTYFYNGNKLSKLVQTDSPANYETQFHFFYDENSNLKEMREYQKNNQTGYFDKYNAVRYSAYDDKKNVENLWMIYPYLPNVSFSNNNFGQISFYHFDGKSVTETSARKFFSYQYDKNGYPVSRKETGSNGGISLTAAYTYSGI